jgi:MOSC domain-containing protein YiiM
VTARLERLWVKRAHRGPMDERPGVRLVAGRGVEGSADQGGRRQVSILAREDWEDAVAAAGGALDPRARRANLLVSGLSLRGTRGRVLAIGEARVRLLGELTPCERMDEALPGLQDAMRPAWRGGVFGEVLVGGEIRAGDEVVLEPAG